MAIKPIVIYTDGASSPNTKHKRGGWGAVLLCGNIEKRISGGVNNTTNQRMEILACIKALKIVKKSRPITLYTDSKYVINGITSWVYNWEDRNWVTSEGKPVINRDLWESLRKLTKVRQITWKWVKGHSNSTGNNIADSLAVRAKNSI